MRNSDGVGVRLALTRWPGRAFLLGLGQLVLVLAGGEALARSTWARNHLPPPSMGIDRVFDAKVAALERLVDEGRSPECIALGHSTTMRSFDPQSLASSIRAASGRDFRCFNLGVPGQTMEVALASGKYIASWARPRLILVGESFDVSWDVPVRPRGWPLPRTARESWEGQLIEASIGYRYLLLARHAIVPYLTGRPPRRMTEYGFIPSRPQGTPGPPDTFRRSRQPPAITPAWLSQLRDLGAPVVLFDTPAHPEVRRLVALMTRNAGVRRRRTVDQGYVVLSPPEELLRAEHYLDSVHMSASGAHVFSEWLGAEIVRTGALR